MEKYESCFVTVRPVYAIQDGVASNQRFTIIDFADTYVTNTQGTIGGQGTEKIVVPLRS